MEATRILAIDPGGVHVGCAAFYRDQDEPWECVLAWECTPDELGTWLPLWFNENVYDLVVLEEFRLYPDKAMAQTGSTMPTCELIGVVKWICQWFNIELVLQPAAIQQPTAAVLRSRGIRSTAKNLGAGGHALSAELHGWHYIVRPPGSRRPAAAG